MADTFASWSPDAQVSPVTRAVNLTASATAFDACRAIHTNTAQTITVQFVDDATTVDLAVAAGASYPYRLVKVTVGTGVTAFY